MEEAIKAIGGNIGYILAGLVSIYTAITKFLEKHKDIATWLVVRIEKDYADGKLTNEEKEQIAIDLFTEKVYPKLPAWKIFIPKFIMIKLIKSMIKSVCAKAKIAKKDS